jgi:hypothetical protein
MYNVGLVGARMLERLLDGEPGMVGWEFDCDELKPLLFEMFGYQNELIERLEIGEDVNERASRDFLDVVQAFF